MSDQDQAKADFMAMHNMTEEEYALVVEHSLAFRERTLTVGAAMLENVELTAAVKGEDIGDDLLQDRDAIVQSYSASLLSFAQLIETRCGGEMLQLFAEVVTHLAEDHAY